jgi:hypothetical protein
MNDQNLPAPEPVPDRNLPVPEVSPEDPNFARLHGRVNQIIINKPIPFGEGRPVGGTYDTKLNEEVPFHGVELDKAGALAKRICNRININGMEFTQKQGGVPKQFSVSSIDSTVYSDKDSDGIRIPVAKFTWSVKQI